MTATSSVIKYHGCYTYHYDILHFRKFNTEDALTKYAFQKLIAEVTVHYKYLLGPHIHFQNSENDQFFFIFINFVNGIISNSAL
jgi:hypothetical protein